VDESKQTPNIPPTPVFYAPKALDGWRWLQTGFVLFWRNPWALTSVALLFMMLPMALALIPAIGTGLAMVAAPGLAAGAMYAAFSVSQQLHPLPHTIFAPFFWGPGQQNLPRLRATLVLGAAYAVLVWLSLMAFLALAGDAWGQLEKLVLAQSESGQGVDVQALEALLQTAPQIPLLLLALMPVVGGLFLLFSRATMLSFCFSLNPGKALFFSAYSILRSIPALLVYGLGLGFASMVAAQLMLVHPFLYAIGLIVFTGVLLCSLWVGFGSSFPPPRIRAMGRERNNTAPKEPPQDEPPPPPAA
jgi:hypothetical protein